MEPRPDPLEAQIQLRSGGCDPAGLAQAVLGCGFDAQAYLAGSPDLLLAKAGPEAALRHFLAYGLDESRAFAAGVLPRGLAALADVAIPDRHYAGQLFRALFFAQLRHADSVDGIWGGLDAGCIAALRRRDALPYFVIGDSHAEHYRRDAWFGTQWLAPLAIACHGATATQLSNPQARNGYGVRLLDWARRQGGCGIPVLLKFGGIDAEYLWILRRMKHRLFGFSFDEFDGFARGSVARYGAFLDAFAALYGAAALRVCAVFPAVLADAGWKRIFADDHRRTPDDDRRFDEDLAQLEVPDLRIRTQLRAVYNSHLRALCADRGWVFVDDFAPLLDAQGVLQRRYYAASGGTDRHLDIVEADETLLAVLRHYLPGGARSVQ